MTCRFLQNRSERRSFPPEERAQFSVNNSNGHFVVVVIFDRFTAYTFRRRTTNNKRLFSLYYCFDVNANTLFVINQLRETLTFRLYIIHNTYAGYWQPWIAMMVAPLKQTAAHHGQQNSNRIVIFCNFSLFEIWIIVRKCIWMFHEHSVVRKSPCQLYNCYQWSHWKSMLASKNASPNGMATLPCAAHLYILARLQPHHTHIHKQTNILVQ